MNNQRLKYNWHPLTISEQIIQQQRDEIKTLKTHCLAWMTRNEEHEYNENLLKSDIKRLEIKCSVYEKGVYALQIELGRRT